MNKLSGLDWIAMILVIIGGINWGLVGLLNFNLVTTIFGTGMLTNIIYDLVGLAGLYMLFVVGRFAKK